MFSWLPLVLSVSFLVFLVYIFIVLKCKNMKEQLRRPFFSRNNLSLSSICFVPGHDDTMPELKESIVGDACCFLDCLRSCPCHCFVLFFLFCFECKKNVKEHEFFLAFP